MYGMTNDKSESRRAIAESIARGRAHLERSKSKRESTRRHLDEARLHIDRLKRIVAR